ncbi:hypothetical protein FGO68_gene17795 [Halteria grandinella]|uniref:Uncharacterized protein n=1 Tax=Halteria grandinella TaxID=5974 RepID=A0A8J8T5L3_HALGN|nr:hypothetical protein FGO68_gene17795 [Halteria grandinella]
MSNQLPIINASISAKVYQKWRKHCVTPNSSKFKVRAGAWLDFLQRLLNGQMIFAPFFSFIEIVQSL